MQERMVSGVLRVVAKRESSFVGLSVRESGARVMRLGLERRERVQGMRRKGAVVSEGAIFVLLSLKKELGVVFPSCEDWFFQRKRSV